MERRTFLSAIGLYPIGARAFGPKTQNTPKLVSAKESGAIAVTPVSRIGRLYECVVGDTPEGQGHIRGGEVEDYHITQFRMSNSSAFDCATPLVPYQEKV